MDPTVVKPDSDFFADLNFDSLNSVEFVMKISKSLKTGNYRKAMEIKEQYEAAKVAGILPVPSNTPIGPFLQALCDYWRKTKRGKGAENDIGRLRVIFGPCCDALRLRPHTPQEFLNRPYKQIEFNDLKSGCFIPARKLEDITPEAISRYLENRVVNEGIQGKTANHLRITLSSMFSYAKKFHGYRCPHPDYKNPVEGVSRFPEKPPIIEWLKDEDIQKQLDTLTEQPGLRAIVATYIYAGLRREEALWLAKEDVDFEQKLIRIRTKEVEGQRWQPKTVERVIPISQKLLAELQAYLPHQKGIWFFSSPMGMRWNPDNLSAHLRHANKKHGIPWSCMEYRHTFGSHLAQKGVSLFKISTLRGNSPEICRKHYAALVPQDMHDDVEF